VEFEVINHRAGLLKTQRKGDLLIQTANPPDSSWAYIHKLMVMGRASLELRIPYFWGHDDFELHVESGLSSLVSPEDELPPESLWDWLGEALDEATASALLALPAGQYLIVRSPLSPHELTGLSIGSDWVETGRHVARLLSYQPDFSEFDHILIDYQAYIIGAEPHESPPGHGPMIGLSFEHYAARRSSFGSFFLPVSHETPGTGGHGELLLMLPMTGPLVIDLMPSFTASQPDWPEAALSYACDLLTGDEPRARRPKKRRRKG